ncbi:MAG TPA: hypothetical protein VGH52_08300 [Gaiellaceae bacterium]|jgi:alkylhydroperoxidase family enzyme
MTTNFERAFESRPDVYAAWRALNGAIKANMDLRRYELATFAAAQRLRSSYCSLAHGKVLADDFGEDLFALTGNRADLSDVDRAVMALAERVVDDAGAITDSDRQKLRDLELSDDEIMDVVLAATARCFFSTTLDALDVRPDASYRELPEDLRRVLVVGRPIADS